jgi:hypothetical protein
MNGGAIGEPFGLQSLLTVVPKGARVYVQGGDSYTSGGGGLAHGRRWFGVDSPTNPYSYLIGGQPQNEIQAVTGEWVPEAGVEKVAVWMFSAKVGRGCAKGSYLYSVPGLE